MNSMNRLCSLTLATQLAVATVGCAGEQKKPETPVPEAPPVTMLTSGQNPAPTKTVSESIAVSEDIARECKLPLANIEKAPRFEFDKSELLPSDRDVLQKIAECVTTGPLKGNKLELIGRADPRGTMEYNMALGARRAASVGSFLQGLGVAPTYLMQTSRGEIDAMGYDEPTWQIDRRVDIRLAP